MAETSLGKMFAATQLLSTLKAAFQTSQDTSRAQQLLELLEEEERRKRGQMTPYERHRLYFAILAAKYRLQALEADRKRQWQKAESQRQEMRKAERREKAQKIVESRKQCTHWPLSSF